MILKFLDSGISKAEDAFGYLLAEKNLEGVVRNPPPELFMGDIDLATHLINTCERKYKYSSAVLAFRDSEKPSDSDLKDILKSFRATFAPGLSEDNFHMVAVKHTHEGNTEIHLIIPMTEMKTGKALNIAPPDNAEKGTTYNSQLIKDFSALTNQKYGWNQVRPNPFRVRFSEFDWKNPDRKQFRERTVKLGDRLADMVKTGAIKNRDGLCNELGKLGVEITRKGKDYISVKFPGEKKARRFKGEMFSDGVSYTSIIEKHEWNSKNVNLSKQEITQTLSRIQNTRNARLQYNKKRYLEAKPRRTYKAKARVYKANPENIKANNLRIACKSALRKLDSLKATSTQPSESFKSRLTRISGKLHNQTKQSQNRTPRLRGSIPSSKMAGVAGIEANIQSVIGELANAKTLEDQIRLGYKLAELMEQRRKMYVEMAEQERLANLNMVPRPR